MRALFRRKPSLDLTFFTAADRRYEMFVVGYAFCALTHNPSAQVEIALEDVGRFRREHGGGLRALESLYPGRLHLRAGNFEGKAPNIVRFLEEPERRAELTYIGDIDILILSEVGSAHRKIMKAMGLPHSNIIRPGLRRLSGLHCARTAEHYPVDLSALAGLDLLDATSDEKFLYQLAESRGQLPPEEHAKRPLHGYHVSLNRWPFGGKGGWGLNPACDAAFRKTFSSDAWQKLKPHIDKRFLWVVAAVEMALLARDTLTPEERARIRVLVPSKGQLAAVAAESSEIVHTPKDLSLSLPD